MSSPGTDWGGQPDFVIDEGEDSALCIPIEDDHPLQGQAPNSASKIGADKMALRLAITMKRLSLSEYLNADNKWTSRLLGLESFAVQRTSEKIHQEYGCEKWGRLLEHELRDVETWSTRRKLSLTSWLDQIGGHG